MFAAASSRHESSTKLMLAMVESSNSPLLLLDGDMVIIAASTSFCVGFHIDPAQVQGGIVFDLGSGEWNSPTLRSLLSATLSGSARIDKYEMELRADGRKTLCLLLSAQKLSYGDEDGPRITLAIADVTDARAAEKEKDDLLRDKATLLQEIQHRVANSLQIIAGVLMMSARKVQSEETRGHLQDAHHRVMSIAAVQKQLTASTLGDVKLRIYFTQLCQSLGASMIHDPRQLALEVDVDESSVSADTSVSLGLIVTKLVINALKHAFPDAALEKFWSIIDRGRTDGPCSSAITVSACRRRPITSGRAWDRVLSPRSRPNWKARFKPRMRTLERVFQSFTHSRDVGCAHPIATFQPSAAQAWLERFHLVRSLAIARPYPAIAPERPYRSNRRRAFCTLRLFSCSYPGSSSSHVADTAEFHAHPDQQ